MANVQRRSRVFKATSPSVRKARGKRRSQRKREASVAAKAGKVVAYVDFRTPHRGMERISSSHQALSGYSWRELVCQGIALVIGTTVVAPTLFTLSDRAPIVELTDPKITPEPVVPGRPMFIAWNVKYFRTCDGIMKRQIVDGSGRVFSFEPISTNSFTKDIKAFIDQVIAPTGMHAGRAVHIVEIKRWCNSIQQLWPFEATYKVEFDVADTEIPKLLRPQSN